MQINNVWSRNHMKRRHAQFQQPRCRTNVFQNSFSPNVISLWHVLPASTRAARTHEAFQMEAGRNPTAPRVDLMQWNFFTCTMYKLPRRNLFSQPRLARSTQAPHKIQQYSAKRQVLSLKKKKEKMYLFSICYNAVQPVFLRLETTVLST